MPTKEKADRIDELTALIDSSVIAILTDYRGLTVADITNLRGQLRSAGVELHVAKNTLTRIAANRLGISELDQYLEGPTAIAFSKEEISQPAKLLSDFARTSKILTIKGALLGRSVVVADEVTRLSELPSKDQLRGQLAGAIQGPLAAVVGVLNGALSGLVYTLEARAQQQGGETAA